MPNPRITLDAEALDYYASVFRYDGGCPEYLALIAQAREALELQAQVIDLESKDWIKAEAWDLRNHTEYVLRNRITELETLLDTLAGALERTETSRSQIAERLKSDALAQYRARIGAA